MYRLIPTELMHILHSPLNNSVIRNMIFGIWTNNYSLLNDEIGLSTLGQSPRIHNRRPYIMYIYFASYDASFVSNQSNHCGNCFDENKIMSYKFLIIDIINILISEFGVSSTFIRKSQLLFRWPKNQATIVTVKKNVDKK